MIRLEGDLATRSLLLQNAIHQRDAPSGDVREPAGEDDFFVDRREGEASATLVVDDHFAAFLGGVGAPDAARCVEAALDLQRTSIGI